MRSHPTACFVAITVTALAAACAKTTDATIVKVTASDDACVLDSTHLTAGSATFRVTNTGNKVTEVYVYGKDDRVVSERENIGPGTSADFSTDLAAGSFEVACKPGQTGDGIRQTITVTGKGGAALPTTANQTVRFDAVDYRYTGLDGLHLQVGKTVKFDMTNRGTVEHEFEIFGPDGEVRWEIGPTRVGKDGTLILELAKPGTYRYICGIDGHEKLGMVGTFTVE